MAPKSTATSASSSVDGPKIFPLCTRSNTRLFNDILDEEWQDGCTKQLLNHSIWYGYCLCQIIQCGPKCLAYQCEQTYEMMD